MSGRIWDKLMQFLGLEDGEEAGETVDEPGGDYFQTRGKNRKIVNIHTAAQMKIVIYEPSSFDQTSEICDNLKERRPVIVNLDSVDAELARRILDFLSGAVYAMDGSIQKIASGIFAIAPSNVDIDANIKEELKDKILFKWQK